MLNDWINFKYLDDIGINIFLSVFMRPLNDFVKLKYAICCRFDVTDSKPNVTDNSNTYI